MSDETEKKYNPSDGLMQLKGKSYLPVAERIVWFRQDYPEAQIETTLVELDRAQGFAMYRARITTGKGGVAEATGSETAKDFGDFIEKAETKAVGRALGYLGFGTAAAGFEEGGRVVDAPLAPKRPNDAPAPAQRAQQAPQPFTADQFMEVIDTARAMRVSGDDYPVIVAYFQANRARMTPDQYEDCKEELRKIKAYTPEGATR